MNLFYREADKIKQLQQGRYINNNSHNTIWYKFSKWNIWRWTLQIYLNNNNWYSNTWINSKKIIGHTAGTTSNIDTATRVTIGVTISTSRTINATTITTILITIETIGDTDGTSSIITIIPLITITIDTIRATAGNKCY